jgi:hypothetical protein
VPGDEPLQRGAAAVGDFDRRQPQLAAIVEQQRAAVAHGGDVDGADRGELAALLRCGMARHERQRGKGRHNCKRAAQAGFHGRGLSELAGCAVNSGGRPRAGPVRRARACDKNAPCGPVARQDRAAVS